MQSATGLLGANENLRTSTPMFKPGTPTLDDRNRTWVYVGPAATAVAANASCTVTGTFGVDNTAGSYTNAAAFAIGEYGWVRKTTSPL